MRSEGRPTAASPPVRARNLEDPEFARLYALKLAKINGIADILGAIEAAREEQHLSKAEIGRRIDRKPSAVSRLLGGAEQNPTWDTLVDLAYAVDLELEVKVKKVPHLSQSRCGELHSRKRRLPAVARLEGGDYSREASSCSGRARTHDA